MLEICPGTQQFQHLPANFPVATDLDLIRCSDRLPANFPVATDLDSFRGKWPFTWKISQEEETLIFWVFSSG